MAFFGSAFSEREKSAEPGIRGAVGDMDEKVGSIVGKCEAGADDQFWRNAALFDDLPGRVISPHDTGQGIEVGDGDGFVAEFGGAINKLVGMRCAAEE